MEDRRENIGAQEKEIVDELEHEVEDLEDEFHQVSNDNVSESVKRKQEQVEDILSEVHEQLDFLREVSEEIAESGQETNQKK